MFRGTLYVGFSPFPKRSWIMLFILFVEFVSFNTGQTSGAGSWETYGMGMTTLLGVTGITLILSTLWEYEAQAFRQEYSGIL